MSAAVDIGVPDYSGTETHVLLLRHCGRPNGESKATFFFFFC